MKKLLLLLTILLATTFTFGQVDSLVLETIVSEIDTIKDLAKYTHTSTFQSGKVIIIKKPTKTIKDKLIEQRAEMRMVNNELERLNHKLDTYKKRILKLRTKKQELLTKKKLLKENWVKGDAPDIL